MNQLNSLIIEGNITKDAELKEPKEGFKVCEISVAVNRYYKNLKGEGSTEVSYFDIEAYGKTAEIAAEKCTKGRGVRVVGRLKQNRWSDPDGKINSKVKIIAEHIEFKPNFAKPDNSKDMSSIAEANSASPQEELNLEREAEREIKQEEEEAVAVF
ncbi:MAG: single-stranded DNA-binding protein [Treponema sp.]|nr:single-stranded DNA-binding protein [Treponema sp.]